MKVIYALENSRESERLKQQAQLKNYNIAEELKYLQKLIVNQNPKILDAGCGAGDLASYLAQDLKLNKIDACDFSDIRIKQAQGSVGFKSNINFFCTDLENPSTNLGMYDFIISRYVFQHLANPSKVLQNLYDHLNIDGYIYLIDSDGFMLNFETSNNELNKYLKIFKAAVKEKKVNFDPYIGSKLESMMKSCKFKEIKINIKNLDLKGQELEDEYEQNVMRFKFAKTMLITIFGEKNADKFIDLYLQEMKNTNTKICYNKVIAYGKK